jgi:hypothetical protein
MNDTLAAGLCMQISGRRYGRGRGEPNDIRRREKLVLLIGRGNIFSRQHQDAGILIDGDPVDKIKENIDLEKKTTTTKMNKTEYEQIKKPDTDSNKRQTNTSHQRHGEPLAVMIIVSIGPAIVIA